MKRLFLIFAVFVAVGSAVAQNGVTSPYSRFGYGFLSDNATAAQRTMGGVGYAMNSGRQINVMNPASYAAIDSLTFLFDMGFDMTATWTSQGSAKNNDFGGGLDYITMQFPICKFLGASIGLLPYSSVGYGFGSSIDNGAVRRNGSGSLNQLYLGVGAKPFRGFTIGANVAYLFGSIYNDVYAVSETSSTLFERSMTVTDYRLDFGAQYSFNVNRDNRLTLGLVYAPRKDMHGKVYGIYYDNTTSSDIKIDTVPGNHKMAGQYSTPEKWGAGINWKLRDNVMIEADFTYEPWSKAKFGAIEDFETTRFADRYRIGLGGMFTPNTRGTYAKRIQYRAGFFYNRDYIMFGDNHVRDFGASLGVGLPVPGFKSIISVGLEYRHRQAYPSALVKEDYLNITIGINFNEMWFRKSKLY